MVAKRVSIIWWWGDRQDDNIDFLTSFSFQIFYYLRLLVETRIVEIIVNAQDQKYRAIINILLTLSSPNRESPVLLPIIMDNKEMDASDRTCEASSSTSGWLILWKLAASFVAWVELMGSWGCEGTKRERKEKNKQQQDHVHFFFPALMFLPSGNHSRVKLILCLNKISLNGTFKGGGTIAKGHLLYFFPPIFFPIYYHFDKRSLIWCIAWDTLAFSSVFFSLSSLIAGRVCPPHYRSPCVEKNSLVFVSQLRYAHKELSKSIVT